MLSAGSRYAAGRRGIRDAFYLDNHRFDRPNSIAGINRTRGLNENIAREILELHTLGVRSGYSQDDVLSFAKVLTG